MPSKTAHRGDAAVQITVLTMVTIGLLAGCAALDPFRDPLTVQ
jgi:hypothetical protein